ncbi:hypothetical protein [Litchfieldia alkalitelluris]|nr:hypothetical protein [Litchfieldia alkalitelluris]
MTIKKLRNFIIVLMLIATLSVVAALNYNGYSSSIEDCIENNGNVTEDRLGFLGFSWTVACEK